MNKHDNNHDGTDDTILALVGLKHKSAVNFHFTSAMGTRTRNGRGRGGRRWTGWLLVAVLTVLSPLCFVPSRARGETQHRTFDLQRRAETAEATAVSKEVDKNWFEQTKEFWDDLEMFLPLEKDQAPEAVALMNQTKKVEILTEEQDALLAKKSYLRGRSDEALGDELNKLQNLSYEYWKMRVYRVFSKESVKQGFVSFLTYGNAIFILIFLRTVVPRLLVISSMDDFFGFANEIGVPSRQTLNDVIRNLASYGLPLKVGIYTLAFIFEKLTLISEILPVQVALKTMSPVVFGGLIPGALISATCETIGATVNFFIGRQFFFQRVRDFQLPGEPVLGDAPWFSRLEKAAETEGFKMTLLLRLSHILPVPFDSYWYILGALPVGAGIVAPGRSITLIPFQPEPWTWKTV
eukprot:s51_g1.t1